jgi:hypothetical protein
LRLFFASSVCYSVTVASRRQMSVRVSFRFPDGDEVRYLDRAPAPDTVIRGRGAEWMVTDVDLDTTGGYLVGVRRKDTPSRQRVPRRSA